MPQPRIADFYTPSILNEIGLISSLGLAAGAWPSANRAIYTPVIFPYPCTITSVAFAAANGTGNYDLGFYDGYTKGKIQSTGSTAMTAAGVKTLTLTQPYRIDVGKLYYVGVALSSTSGTAVRGANEVPSLIRGGYAQEASALPLPTTMTPVTVASAYCLAISFGVR